MFDVNEFLAITQEVGLETPYEELVAIRPHIVCKDGFAVSVQASRTHYCTPRTNRGPYSAVEVGYPSERPPDSWAEYYDGEWQDRPGLPSYLARLWKERSSVWYALRNRRWYYFKSLTSSIDNTTNGVYGYVPVGMVEELIEGHGGVDWDATKLSAAE